MSLHTHCLPGRQGFRRALHAGLGALCLGATVVVGAAWAQSPVNPATDEGPLGRYRPTHTEAQRKRILKNLATGVTIPNWQQAITSPLDGKTYTMTMVGSSSPFSKTVNSQAVKFLTIALKIRVQTANGVVVQDPKTAPCGEKTSAIDLVMQSPLFVPVPYSVNGVDVTANVGGAAQLSGIFQRANFWGELTRNNPMGNHWQVKLRSVDKNPVFEEMDLGGTSRVYSCDGVPATSARVKLAEFEPKLRDLLKKHAAPNQIIFVVPYNVVFLSRDETFIATGYHDAMPIGDDVQTYAVSSYFDSVSYTNLFHLHDIDSLVHEYIEWLNDPFPVDTIPPIVGPNTTPAWARPDGKCQDNLEPGDVIASFNAPPYTITGTNGFAYHFADSVFYQWFYRLPSTAAGGKYSMMGTLSTYQDKVCH